MDVWVLIKDYGYEGQQVHGVTTSLREAHLWCLGDYCWVVPATVGFAPTNDKLGSIKIVEQPKESGHFYFMGVDSSLLPQEKQAARHNKDEPSDTD